MKSTFTSNKNPLEDLMEEAKECTSENQLKCAMQSKNVFYGFSDCVLKLL